MNSKSEHDDSTKSSVVRQQTAVIDGGCKRCGKCGSSETYANQALLPLNGKVVCIDWCIHHLVAAINAGGIDTVACCCGHGTQQGRIDLSDGRILWIESPEQ